MERLPLSLCLIARNEERNLERCLQSAQAWVSEIVVVINDCTDGTAAVARRFGARVYEEPWRGHRDQKNSALEKATQPWVLCLDADEEVSPDLGRAIRRFVQMDDARFAGARFPRKVWVMGRWITHGDWYPDWSLRLLRRGKGRWGGSREHDKLEVQGPCAKLKGDLHHYTFASMNQHLSKVSYFGDIFLARQLDGGKRWCAPLVVLRSAWRFFRAYVLRAGFLDGYPGFYIAAFTAFSTFFRHSRLYEHQHGAARPEEP